MDTTKGGATPVLYARRCAAKQLKTALEASGRIDGDHRMGAADPAAFATSWTRSEAEASTCSSDECICIPVTNTCLKEYQEWHKNNVLDHIDRDGDDWKRLVVASGRQRCMASASASARAKQGGGGRRRRRHDDGENDESLKQCKPTLTEQALLEMVQQFNSSGLEMITVSSYHELR
jgi:hypothetical protein